MLSGCPGWSGEASFLPSPTYHLLVFSLRSKLSPELRLRGTLEGDHGLYSEPATALSWCPARSLGPPFCRPPDWADTSAPILFFQVVKRPQSCKGIQGNRAYMSHPLTTRGRWGLMVGMGRLLSSPDVCKSETAMWHTDRVFTPLSYQAALATYHFPAVNERSLTL